MTALSHKAGFVNIIGKPNVGKSTLMNVLLGEKLSIITAKAQTTRHRVAGILSGDDFQIIYADTPGIITPNYALQQSMMRAVRSALVDTDVLLWVVDVRDQDLPTYFIERLLQQTTPAFLILNKIDLISEVELEKILQYWSAHISVNAIIPVSASTAYNTELVFMHILNYLPEHPPYYPKDMLTDRPERFFVAEIIREKILRNYHQEIPYSVEVVIDSFEEKKKYRQDQCHHQCRKAKPKRYLDWQQRTGSKKVGIEARQDLEEFLGKKVFLEQHVKVLPGWRTKSQLLHQFGYA